MRKLRCRETWHDSGGPWTPCSAPNQPCDSGQNPQPFWTVSSPVAESLTVATRVVWKALAAPFRHQLWFSPPPSRGGPVAHSVLRAGSSRSHHPAGLHVTRRWRNHPGLAAAHVGDMGVSRPEPGWVEESLRGPRNDAGSPAIRDGAESLSDDKCDEFWTRGLVSLWHGKVCQVGDTADSGFVLLIVHLVQKKRVCALKWAPVTFVSHSFNLLLLQFSSCNSYLLILFSCLWPFFLPFLVLCDLFWALWTVPPPPPPFTQVWSVKQVGLSSSFLSLSKNDTYIAVE